MALSTQLTRFATAMAAVAFAAASPSLLAAQPAPAAQPETTAATAASAQPPGGGYGMGPRAMWGYGGGPGMMGNYGMNPAMAGPYGRGMMGYTARPLPMIQLTPQQEAQMGKIQQEFREKQLGLMTQMRNEMIKMRGLYSSENRDNSAISSEFQRMNTLRQQMFENMVEARKQVQGVLTKEQLQQMSSYWPMAAAAPK